MRFDEAWASAHFRLNSALRAQLDVKIRDLPYRIRSDEHLQEQFVRNLCVPMYLKIAEIS